MKINKLITISLRILAILVAANFVWLLYFFYSGSFEAHVAIARAFAKGYKMQQEQELTV